MKHIKLFEGFILNEGLSLVDRMDGSPDLKYRPLLVDVKKRLIEIKNGAEKSIKDNPLTNPSFSDVKINVEVDWDSPNDYSKPFRINMYIIVGKGKDEFIKVTSNGPEMNNHTGEKYPKSVDGGFTLYYPGENNFIRATIVKYFGEDMHDDWYRGYSPNAWFLDWGRDIKGRSLLWYESNTLGEMLLDLLNVFRKA